MHLDFDAVGRLVLVEDGASECDALVKIDSNAACGFIMKILIAPHRNRLHCWVYVGLFSIAVSSSVRFPNEFHHPKSILTYCKIKLLKRLSLFINILYLIEFHSDATLIRASCSPFSDQLMSTPVNKKC